MSASRQQYVSVTQRLTNFLFRQIEPDCNESALARQVTCRSGCRERAPSSLSAYFYFNFHLSLFLFLPLFLFL